MAINVGDTTVGYSAAHMTVTSPATLKQNYLESDFGHQNHFILLTQQLTATVSFSLMEGMRNLKFEETLTTGDHRQRADSVLFGECPGTGLAILPKGWQQIPAWSCWQGDAAAL